MRGTTSHPDDLDGNRIAETFGPPTSKAKIVREYIELQGIPVIAMGGINTATPISSTPI
jgi:hypothetical protein